MLKDKHSYIQKNLLTWFYKHARNLPWRKNKDPYGVWISEIMLQQTQVKTVIPYYNAFLKRFPDVQSLAKASDNDILQHWQGLGYYRRAKYMHQAAKTIVEEHQSELPQQYEQLLTLPGFGPYTAAAVASIAFNEKIASIDGNVQRVASRIHSTHTSITQEHVIDWLNTSNPGDSNQALMELGATLCSKQKPQCPICPIQKACQSKLDKTTDQYPKTKVRAKKQKLYVSIFLIPYQNSFYVEQRTNQEQRWYKLWQFPNLESKTKPKLKDIQTFLNAHLKTTHFTFQANKQYKHQLTHIDITAQVYTCQITQKTTTPKHWASYQEKKHPLSTFQKKALPNITYCSTYS